MNWPLADGRAGASAEDSGQLDVFASQLYSAVISDILDDLGFRNQVLPAEIQAIDPSTRLVGYAATLLAADEYVIPDRPYEGQIDAVDGLAPGSIAVIATGRSDRCAFWGELFSTAARARGCRGTLIDGFTRDSERISAMAYPVFCRGARPIDIKGRSRVIEAGVLVELGGVRIRPGDLIFGDRDGVVVVPREVEDSVVGMALAKVNTEDHARDALREGVLLRAVWERDGVL